VYGTERHRGDADHRLVKAHHRGAVCCTSATSGLQPCRCAPNLPLRKTPSPRLETAYVQGQSNRDPDQ
jgi:hypothetical protein